MAGPMSFGALMAWALAVYITAPAEARAEGSCLLQHRSVVGIAGKGAATENEALPYTWHHSVSAASSDFGASSELHFHASDNRSLTAFTAANFLQDFMHRMASLVNVEHQHAHLLSHMFNRTLPAAQVAAGKIGRSKIILLMLEISTCGIFGFDRMYMGEWEAGIGKLLGGFFLVYCLVQSRAIQRAGRCIDNVVCLAAVLLMWDLVDYLVVLDACLFKRIRLSVIGFHAEFTEDAAGEETAFLLAAIHVLSMFIACVIWCCLSFDSSPMSEGSGRRRGNSRAVMEALNHSRTDTCEKGLEEPCPICLESIADGQQMQTLPCFHILHHACATLHFKKTSRRHAFCPVCRNNVGPSPEPDVDAALPDDDVTVPGVVTTVPHVDPAVQDEIVSEQD